ncbi:MAG: molybdopterin molybdotransferase MoeA [Nitrospinae bacterium]|nr:molybdopterin molybdotransferase MoeA [Nitrospinota bacterium]
MITVEQAREIIAGAVKPTSAVENVPLSQAAGRVLAAPVLSDVDIPPFNRVTMDGYAIVSSDGPGKYEVCEYVPAGAFPKVALTAGKVSRVMTGAPLPEGADAVIQVEKTGGFVEVGKMAQILEKSASGLNVAKMGEDLRKGDLVLPAGTRLEFPEISALAAVGAEPVPVFRLPSVAVLATGDELVPPSVKPQPGKIRDSNQYSLAAQLKAVGITPSLLGIAKDERDDLAQKMAEGKKHDFLLISGGVSEGDRDYVPEALDKAGYKILFRNVRVRPGKPLTFGAADDGKYVFGLPGNPVSTAVIFELFIRNALALFEGDTPAGRLQVETTLFFNFKRKKGEREEYVPVNLVWRDGGFIAEKVRYQGSGHFHALTAANGLIKVPVGVTEIAGGSKVEARFIREGR